MTETVHTRLQAARARLILERPFVGNLVMHLPLAAADPAWCHTVATDARTLYFNPRYIEALDFSQVQFALAHVALHCALGHFARRGHRERARWDVATDHAVNLLLVDDGLKPAPGALLDPRFRGLAAEEIYPLIPPHPEAGTLDRHRFDEPGGGRGAGAQFNPGGTGWDDAGDEGRFREACAAHAPPELDAAARDALARAWRGRLVAGAQQARRAGRLGASWLRVLDQLALPRLSWRALLARRMMSVSRDDYSFQRLSRRGGDALLPGRQSGTVDLCLALDTSGSIGAEDLRQFTSEVDALKAQVRARVTVHACDESLDAAGPWVFETWEPIVLPARLRGGGETSFRPVFDWIERGHLRPDLLVYFTDAEGEFPDSPPGYPVVWLVKGRGAVPWGERIQLN
jgi:predicted metal-dependent peptidase